MLIFYFFTPYNVMFMFTSQILHGFFYGITIPILWAMIADVADYSEWKNNRRATAIIFSAMMVGLKAGLSIGGALVAWILGLYGYINREDVIGSQTIIQPESIAQGAKMLISVYASIPFLLAFVLLYLYKINKAAEVQIESELRARRISKQGL
jgi:Na+/melibiose symporter-like transporter